MGFLKHKRNKRFDPLFVIWVRFWEMLGQKLLFLACPEPRGDKENGKCDEAYRTAVEDYHAKNHKQKTTINWMAHIGYMGRVE